MVRAGRKGFRYGTHVNGDRRNGFYIRISAGPLRGKYVHRLVLEAKLGRPLRDDEQAHHINGNTLDNSPENLQAVPRVKHGPHKRGVL